MNANLARWILVMGPGFVINEEVGFSAALVWMIACLMIIVAVSRSAWTRR